MKTIAQSSDGLVETTGPYAVVVVNTTLKSKMTTKTALALDEDEEQFIRAFHYHIPETLAPVLQPGHLVWVRFRSRYLQGIIVALDESSPVKETRPLGRLIDPEPILFTDQLKLAHWISRYYLAPIHRVIWSMIPPGIMEQAKRVVEPTEAEPDEAALNALTPGQRSIYALLEEKGPLPLDEIPEHTQLRTWRAMIDHLVDAGLARYHVALLPARVRPKYQEFIRLRPGLDPQELPKENMPRQQDVVDFCRSWRFFQGDPQGWLMRSTVQDETGVSQSPIKSLIGKGVLESVQRRVWRDPLAGRSFVPVIPPQFTTDQEAIWEQIESELQNPQTQRPFLLQGVTGSGKTEIYLRAVQRVLSKGQGAIVLVPEIALTPQTVRRFGARHPSTMAVMHSELSAGERYDQWQRIRSGDLRLVIGSRSAIFSPVKNLGLIVLDEEHEWTYKQDRVPRYHARDVALRLAEISGAAVILGSATPSLESAYRAERGQMMRLTLPQRVMGHRRVVEEQIALAEQNSSAEQDARGGQNSTPQSHAGRYQPISDRQDEETLYTDLPPVHVVDLRAELRAGNTSILSRALHQALDATLEASEQAILFLNRRGSASFVLCRDCGYVVACPRCELPLTYHANEQNLICHHCNLQQPPLEQCPECLSKRIRYFGVGTQRVEHLVNELFPAARVVRWDYDSTRGKNGHERLLDQFIRGEADIMIGTQMVAKGLDLPRVTLVGVITADTILNLPEYTAGERTFQLLTQVAGRAGRSVLGGQVIIQTYMPDHPAIKAASDHDYDRFYQREIAFRREQWYPPLSRLIRLVRVGTHARQVQHEAESVYHVLEQRIARLGLPQTDLIGPAPAFYERVANRWRWHIIVRGNDPAALLRDVSLSPGWRIDVDPESLL